jgi:hypothetical protein
MENNLRKYIDRKFFMYPKTNEIVELREELYSMMQDKYNDCLKEGLPAEQSYKEAISILTDYKTAIREVETGSSLGALKKKLVSSLAFSAFYFIALTCIYLYVSMISLNSFEQSWLIIVGGAFVYLIYFAASMSSYAKLFDMRILTRCSVGVLFLSIIPLVYVFPNLVLSELYSVNTWNHSWIVIPILLFIYLLVDLIMFGKNTPKLFKDIQLLVAGFILTTIVYLIVSVQYDLWSRAWIMYVAYLAIVSLVLFIDEKAKQGRNKTGTAR